LVYHYPRHIWREGWEWHYHFWKGRRDMIRALATLPVPTTPAGASLELHYLTGRRYVPLTTVSLLSAQATFGRPVIPVLYDDGTLDNAATAPLTRLFPAARVVRSAMIGEALDRVLPVERFPCLRQLRLSYIHLRKLTDIHASPGPDWRLVLDSDVFFFRRPAQLLDLVQRPAWCHMVDCQQSYDAPQPLLETLAGVALHPRVNVGLCHLQATALDWPFIESCAATILARHGFTYYLEQALAAILMAQARATPLSAEDYLVYPSRKQGREPEQVALHYVDRSFLLLYRYGWRQVLSQSAAPRTQG
jgi:hypothetical protein